MKKRLVATVLAAAFLLSAVGCSKAQTGNYLMSTGGTSGTYYPFSGAIAQIWNDKIEGTNVTIQASGGSKENIQLIANKEADIAIVQNDVLDYAIKGTEIFEKTGAVEGVSTLATVYPEVCHIVVAGNGKINSVSDLKGKKVSVGDSGSGVEANARQILEAYGMSFDDIKKQNLSFKESGDALKNGQIDAYFATSGIPNTSIVDAMVQTDIDILSIDADKIEALKEKYPFYTEYTIPTDVYKLDDEVNTLAVKATLIVSSDLPEEEVYNMTKTLYENLDSLSAAHSKGKEVKLEQATDGVSVPLHPGAERYFKETGVIK